MGQETGRRDTAELRLLISVRDRAPGRVAAHAAPPPRWCSVWRVKPGPGDARRPRWGPGRRRYGGAPTSRGPHGFGAMLSPLHAFGRPVPGVMASVRRVSCTARISSVWCRRAPVRAPSAAQRARSARSSSPRLRRLSASSMPLMVMVRSSPARVGVGDGGAEEDLVVAAVLRGRPPRRCPAAWSGSGCGGRSRAAASCRRGSRRSRCGRRSWPPRRRSRRPSGAPRQQRHRPSRAVGGSLQVMWCARARRRRGRPPPSSSSSASPLRLRVKRPASSRSRTHVDLELPRRSRLRRAPLAGQMVRPSSTGCGPAWRAISPGRAGPVANWRIVPRALGSSALKSSRWRAVTTAAAGPAGRFRRVETRRRRRWGSGSAGLRFTRTAPLVGWAPPARVRLRCWRRTA